MKLAKGEFCAFVRGLEDGIWTYLAVMLSGTLCHKGVGSYRASVTPTAPVGMVLHQGVPNPLSGPCITPHTCISAICGKYNFGK